MLTDLDFIWEIVDPVNTKLREFEEGGAMNFSYAGFTRSY